MPLLLIARFSTRRCAFLLQHVLPELAGELRRERRSTRLDAGNPANRIRVGQSIEQRRLGLAEGAVAHDVQRFEESWSGAIQSRASPAVGSDSCGECSMYQCIMTAAANPTETN